MKYSQEELEDMTISHNQQDISTNNKKDFEKFNLFKHLYKNRGVKNKTLRAKRRSSLKSALKELDQ